MAIPSGIPRGSDLKLELEFEGPGFFLGGLPENLERSDNLSLEQTPLSFDEKTGLAQTFPKRIRPHSGAFVF